MGSVFPTSERSPRLHLNLPGVQRVVNPHFLRVEGWADKPPSQQYSPAAVCFFPAPRNALELLELKAENAQWTAQPGELLEQFACRILDSLGDSDWPLQGIMIFESLGFWELNSTREAIS